MSSYSCYITWLRCKYLEKEKRILGRKKNEPFAVIFSLFGFDLGPVKDPCRSKPTDAAASEPQIWYLWITYFLLKDEDTEGFSNTHFWSKPWTILTILWTPMRNLHGHSKAYFPTSITLSHLQDYKIKSILYLFAFPVWESDEFCSIQHIWLSVGT